MTDPIKALEGLPEDLRQIADQLAALIPDLKAERDELQGRIDLALKLYDVFVGFVPDALHGRKLSDMPSMVGDKLDAILNPKGEANVPNKG